MDTLRQKSEYGVIIIGAGPAGISTALNLVNNGINDILIVEKHKFPRYKCCAGYITEKTGKVYKKNGLDIADCHYSLIKDFNILYKQKKKLTIENKFLYTNKNIDRVELDNAFFELAKSKGIEISENVKITAHDISAHTVTLSDGKIYGYGYLVFADGTEGFSSRYRKAKKKNIAMQLTFESNEAESINIHFGITKKGYGWVSSFDGITNVGLTDVYSGVKDYKKIFADFLHSQGFNADINNLKSAFTPIGVRTAVINSNVFFVGDAVGACDPLTLSGLRYGLDSGQYCAKAIASGNVKIYKKYIRNLKSKFNFMKIMLKVFYVKPVLFMTFNCLCRFFGKPVAAIFNNFFVNKK